MFISPFILNNNTVTVKATPGTFHGDSVLVTVEPATAAVELENAGVTVTDSVRTPLVISRRWRERSNVITVEGEIHAGGKTDVEQISVWQPERYAALVFAERLREHGVDARGVRVDTAGPAGVEIARYVHLLDTAATFMNKVSDNLSAESLLKTLGAERRGRPGSAEQGITVVHELLTSIPYDTNAVSIADGSGLSRYNLTSPDAIVSLLRRIHADPTLFSAFYRTLPIAGVDGTLEERMRGTAAEGNLRAKTGSLNGVSALSGYVRTKDQELLAFSIMMQSFPGGSRPYRTVQDRIGAFLSEFTRRVY
jgi:D-alanyl-D-alanine carboxypeptidase/D-alanyl-D-alanine-endopeptidase (penicillin-binding protein 4)